MQFNLFYLAHSSKNLVFARIYIDRNNMLHKSGSVINPIRHQQTPPLTTSDKCHNLRERGPVAHVDNRELHGDGDHGNTAVTADTPR